MNEAHQGRFTGLLSGKVLSQGNSYVVVLMDYMTKWLEAFVIPDELFVEEIIMSTRGIVV